MLTCLCVDGVVQKYDSASSQRHSKQYTLIKGHMLQGTLGGRCLQWISKGLTGTLTTSQPLYYLHTSKLPPFGLAGNRRSQHIAAPTPSRCRISSALTLVGVLLESCQRRNTGWQQDLLKAGNCSHLTIEKRASKTAFSAPPLHPYSILQNPAFAKHHQQQQYLSNCNHRHSGDGVSAMVDQLQTDGIPISQRSGTQCQANYAEHVLLQNRHETI